MAASAVSLAARPMMLLLLLRQRHSPQQPCTPGNYLRALQLVSHRPAQLQTPPTAVVTTTSYVNDARPKQ